ncbi:BTAD domain-containing putative transcriptional regulator [Actinokineospora sp. NBRC 105648]|uniref:BTAD domain-containing putative transcriptional regulator n=1 Tax=Actinokineospora sp. NBRC 105648 TaxID=3032206 RepID=UPI0025523901|nr:BTAD domain-containing putative transcriptional regulator [Actinokineospora sp. NBRC 105648]
MAVEVRLLGAVELVVDGTAAGPAGVRPRAVLAVLAASGDTPVPGDRLAEAVYSDTGRPATRTTVQVHVHTVRQALGKHGALLRHTPAGYLLTGAVVDVRAAEDAVALARAADRAGDATGAAFGYRQALSLWRGQFCADLPDHAALDPARALYAELRWEAVEARVAADLRAGSATQLVHELEGLVADNPLRERLWGHLMAALYLAGRQSDALDRYRQARRVLADEAGVDPGSALRDLERAVLAHAGTATVLRVVAPGPPSSGRPMLTWVDGTGRARVRELPAAGRVLIGRDAAAEVALHHDGAVSREHAAITVVGGRAVVADLGSRNGTFHNGRRLTGEVLVRPGDLIRCGDTVVAITAGPTGAVDGTTTRDGDHRDPIE